MRYARLYLSILLPGLACAEVVPFGSGLKAPSIREIKPAEVTSIAIGCLEEPNASRWTVELPPDGRPAGEIFRIGNRDGRKSLCISSGALKPAFTTVRILLPGDGGANGSVWSKSKANHVSFLCKSDKPVQMTFHLLQRGKTSGTFQTGFSAKPGDWRRVVLPMGEFNLTSFSSVAGLGVRSVAGEPAAEVLLTDFQAGGMPFSESTLQARRLAIPLRGDWRFATDPADEGMKQDWYADRVDDSAWKVLQSGESWQQQGVDHYGWGWYRQKLFVPKGLEGIPLTLNLVPIASDDDTWFNGKRVGGISSEYKYKNLITRSYTVPASLVRYGEENTIAIRIWGGNITFIGNDSGLVRGPLTAVLDPFQVYMRDPGGKQVPAPLYDLSEAQRGRPFEILFPFPAEMGGEPGVRLAYRLSDYTGKEIASGAVPLQAAAEGLVHGVVSIDSRTAQVIYFRGRFRAALVLEDAAGQPLYAGTRDVDYLSFASRDNTPLPALPATMEDTPYGSLRLVDVLDCATPVTEEPHPYLQGGFDNKIAHMTPGAEADVQVVDILGRKARESGYSWFAYRIGRGKLKPHTTYLLRIEYPEDKPRFCPLEIQTGQNFMDVGWKNGVAPDDVYDNWPLSKAWQWYDVIVPLDDQTVGTGGTGSASAENGVWVYFMNKRRPGMYYAMWEGGPAIARMKLYEIDPVKNAPVIRRPEGLPNRVLSLDWERQPDHDPADLVKYAKLMGYSAISPVILKWFFANYSDPLDGYTSVNIDARDYWAQKAYDPANGEKAVSPWPGRESQHVRYLEATRRFGLDYIPRVEWGGSQDLPVEARAIDSNGQPTKPNRFAPWCANLLHPATWDDLERLMDHLVKPYVKDNPQLAGVLWRIRCNRLPISYGPADIALFFRETGKPMPPGAYAQRAAWAVGEGKTEYDDWWHRKRAAFHVRLVNLLQSYRPGLKLYYFNWDPDKIGMIEPDITAWAFVANVVKPAPEGGRAAYEKERAVRRTFTAADYIHVLHTGNFGNTYNGLNRADLGIRPSLYKDTADFQIFAPAHYRCYADMPDYLNYFQTADGLAASHVVSYDEIGSRTINPKYEGNMMTPGGAPFSMALELLPYFHGDARTLNYTVYTYGRGFADAHRRFAQAFLALPAIPGVVVDHGEADLKVRTYSSTNGTYVGVAYKGHAGRAFTVSIPAKPEARVINLVTGQEVPATPAGGALQFKLESGPMELNAFLVR